MTTEEVATTGNARDGGAGEEGSYASAELATSDGDGAGDDGAGAAAYRS